MTLTRTSRMITPDSSRPSAKHGSTWCWRTSLTASVSPGQDHVEQQDVGPRLDQELRLHVGDVVRRPAGEQLHDQEDEHDADPEDRRGVADDAEDADAGVHRGVAAATGDPAERDADDEGEDEGAERQREGRAALVADDVEHRPVVADGLAEVEAGDVAEVLEVLHDERPVEAERRAAGVEGLLAELPADRGRDRVSRGDAEQDEHDGEEHPDHRDDQHEPDRDVAGERAS